MKSSRIRSGASPSTGALCPCEVRERLPERRGNQIGRTLVAGLLAAVLVTAPSLALAKDSAAEVSKESGLGAAAAVSSLFYGPTKLLYATGGVVVGAFAWIFTAGDSEVAGKVFTRSLRGDYVITPAMLLGEESLEFIGREPNEEPTAPAAAVASTTSGYEDSEYDDLGW